MNVVSGAGGLSYPVLLWLAIDVSAAAIIPLGIMTTGYCHAAGLAVVAATWFTACRSLRNQTIKNIEAVQSSDVVVAGLPVAHGDKAGEGFDIKQELNNIERKLSIASHKPVRQAAMQEGGVELF